MHTYSEITVEDLHSVTVMQLSPVFTKGDADELLEKKYVQRRRKTKRKYVTTKN